MDYWVACSLTNVTIHQLLSIVLVVVIIIIRVALRGRKQTWEEESIPYIMTEHVSTLPTTPSSCVFKKL
jgi:hypothetical protein